MLRAFRLRMVLWFALVLSVPALAAECNGDPVAPPCPVPPFDAARVSPGGDQVIPSASATLLTQLASASSNANVLASMKSHTERLAQRLSLEEKDAPGNIRDLALRSSARATEIGDPADRGTVPGVTALIAEIKRGSSSSPQLLEALGRLESDKLQEVVRGLREVHRLVPDQAVRRAITEVHQRLAESTVH